MAVSGLEPETEGVMKPRPLPCLSSGRAETAKHRPENFLDTLSNSGPAVRLYSEGRATGPPEDRYRRLS